MAEYKESLGEDEISSKLVMDLLIGLINQTVYFRHKCTDDDDDDDDKTEHSHKLARTEWNCKKETIMLLNTITAYPDNKWYWN